LLHENIYRVKNVFINPIDIFRKAIALFEVVREARKEGCQILIVDPKSGNKKEIIGI
jgi:hypothetical protein